ncbi:MAG: triphosphoribosyl-dephospho-CoA synthase CitG [Lachnospiraceae bacterium]|nr:triphosphoribosyl-dephospho-CoA synthase CitG [Lachnospiraceae bacterium]
MQEATLEQVLSAREARAALQQKLLNTYHCPLISFTMNIAGPVKTSPLIERAFETGLDELTKCLPAAKILFRHKTMEITGFEALLSVDMEAVALKKICTDIEDAAPLGRLFDMDVLEPDGHKLNRDIVKGGSRNCLVCGAPGRGCAARRLHSVAELQAVTNSIMKEHFITADREHIADLAVQSLKDEVFTTPKPGLVDRRNNGSHTDMNLKLFLLSADTLKPYFTECVKIGQETNQLEASETFPHLRQAGIKAEQDMFHATEGVNTHKGAIYTLGVLCGALGRLWTPEKPISDANALLAECAKMMAPHVENDFAVLETLIPQLTDISPARLTSGQRLYLEHGLTGIRGEAAAGFPSVAHIALPVYEKALQDGLTSNDAGTVTLLHLIARVSDTNLYHRGGTEGASFAANAARSLLETTDYPPLEQMEALDDAFIARNLSPGGCADLLAVTYFLHTLTVESL